MWAATSKDDDVTTGERLAAYLAGDLGADDAAAVQAELARDPGLRAQLEQLRATDALLADLPTPTPTADFSAALREAVRAEVAALPEAGTVIPASELERRRRRRLGFQRAVAGVAAAAAVAAGVVVVGDLGGDDTLTTAAEGARDFDVADSGGDGAADAGMAEMAPAFGPEPVLARGGAYDEDSLGALADDPRLREVFAAAASDPVAMALRAQDLGLQLDATSRTMAGATATAPGATGGGAGEAAADDSEEASQDSLTAPAVAPDSLDPIGLANRCLPPLYDDEEQRVPLWLEVATFDGEPALVAVLSTHGQDAELSRMEFYAIAVADCHVLFFQQVDA